MSTTFTGQDGKTYTYTEETFNGYFHSAILANHGPAILSHDSGHLRYEKGRGVVKTQEADCHFCEEQGLNDGRWHSVEEINARNHN